MKKVWIGILIISTSISFSTLIYLLYNFVALLNAI